MYMIKSYKAVTSRIRELCLWKPEDSDHEVLFSFMFYKKPATTIQKIESLEAAEKKFAEFSDNTICRSKRKSAITVYTLESEAEEKIKVCKTFKVTTVV